MRSKILLEFMYFTPIARITGCGYRSVTLFGPTTVTAVYLIPGSTG